MSAHEGFERITHVRLPYDRRHDDYGIHGLDIVFVLKGPNGAVHFAMTAFAYVSSLWGGEMFNAGKMQGNAIGYHSPKARYQGQVKRPCEYLPERECYSDASALLGVEWGEEVFAITGAHPDKAVWAKLEARYDALFGDTPMTEPAGMGETLKEAFDVLPERTD